MQNISKRLSYTTTHRLLCITVCIVYAHDCLNRHWTQTQVTEKKKLHTPLTAVESPEVVYVSLGAWYSLLVPQYLVCSSFVYVESILRRNNTHRMEQVSIAVCRLGEELYIISHKTKQILKCSTTGRTSSVEQVNTSRFTNMHKDRMDITHWIPSVYVHWHTFFDPVLWCCLDSTVDAVNTCHAETTCHTDDIVGLTVVRTDHTTHGSQPVTVSCQIDTTLRYNCHVSNVLCVKRWNHNILCDWLIEDMYWRCRRTTCGVLWLWRVLSVRLIGSWIESRIHVLYKHIVCQMFGCVIS